MPDTRGYIIFIQHLRVTMIDDLAKSAYLSRYSLAVSNKQFIDIARFY
nr:MAG TPA: hypothetical protein [Caudoviricetes sp.]